MRRRTLLAGSGAALLPAPSIAREAPAATLRFVPAANLTILDPVVTSDPAAGVHGYYVFDTLYAVDGTLTPRPQMAAGHEVADGGRTWRIRLREGLRFHDGTPVRGIDCVASLRRWCARKPFGQLLAAATEAWRAPDDRTLELRLVRPFPLLLDAIAAPDAPAWMMPERLALADPNTGVKEMTGSGPYRFVPGAFNSGSRVVYERFDGYVPRSEPPDWASGGKVAHFKRIEWHVIPDPATAANALMTGEVDWWEAPLPDLMPLLKANPDIAFQVGKPLGGIAYTRLNCLQPPFSDTKARQAVLLAVVQDDYMRAAFGDDTALWAQCRSLWPKRTPYYDEADTALMPGSLAAGRAALRQTRYAGEKVVLMQPTDRPAENAFSQVTAELLRALGMNVEVQAMDWGTLVQRRGTREPVEKGGWSLFHGSSFPATVCANPGSSYFVRGQGAKGWEGWWGSAEAEALASSWVNAPDEASRREYARQLGHLALSEAATIPLGQSFDQTAFRTRITGIIPGARPYPWGVRPA